jgi:dipeptidyl aminopeptidase/acylaminoacyl peptidase
MRQRFPLTKRLLILLILLATACGRDAEETPAPPTVEAPAGDIVDPPRPATATPPVTPDAGTQAAPQPTASPTTVPAPTPTLEEGLDLASLTLFAEPGVTLLQVAPLLAQRSDLPAAGVFLGAAPNGRWLAFADAGALYLFAVADNSVVALPGYPNVSWGTWSPDSRRLGLVAGGRLIVAAVDGDSPVANVVAATVDDRPASVHWSPDSLQLIYLCDDTLATLCTVRADGTTGPQTLFDGTMIQPLREPRWSPDGSRIAFLARDNNDVEQLFRINADGSEPAQMTAGNFASVTHRWSPEGHTHLVVRRSDTLVDLALVGDDAALRSLFAEAAADLNDLVPTWLPNGQQIGFFYTRDSNAAAFSVARIDVANSGRTVLAEGIRFASWSPDGRYLALVTRGGLLEVLDTASGLQVAATECDADCWQVAWLP